MSRDGKITLDWADGTHTFRLGIAQIEELQEKTDCGPYFLLNRINSGTWRVADLRETIRLGLIGGGLTPAEALPLVRWNVEGRPLMESVAPARAILMAALMGAPDGEKTGKKRRAAKPKTKPPSDQTDGSALPPITAQAPSSGSPR